MDGDLSLSQSLGGLRIANPDDGSPDLSKASPPPPVNAVTPTTSDPLQTSGNRPSSKSELPTSPISPLDRQLQIPPSATSQNAPSTTSASLPLRNTKPDAYDLRNGRGPTIPFTYQDQQQAQFPQYPAMMPQKLHDPRTNATRPVSSFYTQMPGNGASPTNPMMRDPNYRFSSEPSQPPGPAIPSRSNSRGGNAALQAGVPTRDDSHSDRTYKQTAFTAGNGPVPPRRASRGMGNGHFTNGNAGSPLPVGTPLSGTYPSESTPVSPPETGRLRKQSDPSSTPGSRGPKKGVKDFNFGKTLGEGSYSTVLAATDRTTLKEYAIKVLDKRHIIKEKKVKYVNIERDTLNILNDHPGIVRLWYTFQDERSLYFVLDFCTGGELLGVLKKMQTFNEECARFYGAQILDAVDLMHQRGVIHRDLKPENVLLDSKMHVKITDFGTAKILESPKVPSNGLPFQQDGDDDDPNRAKSFVGTAEYVSPELLKDKSACKASDLWAFGCIIYQLLAGRPPFKASNEYQTFQKIVALNYEFPKGFPKVAQDLVERLLVLDPTQRLPIEHIKNHEFFDGVTWGPSLWNQKAPRLQPYVPPTTEPIKLNASKPVDSYPPNIAANHSTHPTILPPNGTIHSTRPQPTVITQLPPPSQLDLEWSPVLTRNNERILKMGDLMVSSSATTHSPHGSEGGKLSRLFGGNANKKRPRMVMVTSSARIILAPVGGEEKKSKFEISLLSPGTDLTSSTDLKGITSWVVDTRDKRFVFEDLKPNPNDSLATANSAQDWLETIERAKEIAISQSLQNSYSGEESFNIPSSAMSSHANTLDHHSEFSRDGAVNPRGHLVKNHSGADTESIKGRRRFSKRQSKNGLAAVF
ncbi:MAG: hypothetical protein Q9227_001820 [Pyrenula ochraceoflavens]